VQAGVVNSKIPWYPKLLFQRENAVVQRVLVTQPKPSSKRNFLLVLISNLIAAIFFLALKISACRTEN
jgi:hypothetical protein